MRNKKIRVYAIAAVVLLIAALILTNCIEPIGMLNLQGSDNSGYSSNVEVNANPDIVFVRLSLFELNARTIMPKDANLPDVEDMTYDVKTTGAYAPADSTGLSYTDLGDLELALTVTQAYTITIDAFVNDTEKVATGSSGSITINESTPTSPITIALKEYTDGDIEGTFTWNLTVPTNATAGTMAVYALADTTFTTPVFTQVNLFNSTDNVNATGEKLDSGFYRVRVHFSGGTTLQPVTITEVLHIYQNMTSDYTETFAALNNIQYTITLDYNNKNPSDKNTDTTVIHGGTLAEPSKDIIGIDPPTTNYIIDGWYTNSTGVGGASGLFVWDSAQVWRPRTFYAKWVPGSRDMGVGVTFDPSDIENTLVINSGNAVKVSQVDLESDVNTVITISGGGITAANTIWRFGNASGTPGVNYFEVTGATLTITKTHLPVLPAPVDSNQVFVPVSVQVYVPAVDAAGTYYSTTFNIEVVIDSIP